MIFLTLILQSWERRKYVWTKISDVNIDMTQFQKSWYNPNNNGFWVWSLKILLDTRQCYYGYKYTCTM